VDIGGRVQAGQLLATIDTPEVDQQLRQAQAAQLQAQANLDLAKTTADRWQNLLKSDGVSQQEVDQNVSAYKAARPISSGRRQCGASEIPAILSARHRAVFRRGHGAKRRYRRADRRREYAAAIQTGAD
jgi:multidrug resistance efflux pump